MIDLTEAMRQVITSSLDLVHTALPCRVESVDGSKVTIKPVVKITDSTGESIEVPAIPNAPIMFPRSKKAGIMWDVEKGDTGLALISEVSLDNWLSGNRDIIVESDDERRFDLTDAVFLPGLFPFALAPKLDDDTGVEMGYEDTTIKIKKSGDIEIGGSSAQRLVNESFKSVYNSHVHSSNGTPTLQVMTDINLTSKTSAL